jgi:DNA-binding GntR family transcriptional regulator
MASANTHNSFEYSESVNQIIDPLALGNGQPNEPTSLNRVRAWLGQSHLAPGSRLPPERALVETLRLSRPELRKALAVLEYEGRIARQVGRGTFVTDRPKFVQTPVGRIDRTHRPA